MRLLLVVLRLTGAFGLMLLFANGPAVAKTRAACQREYAAKKAAGEATGKNEQSYVRACLATDKVAPAPAAAESPGAGPDANALREAAQNPIANLISVPFQNNTNFSVGPYHQTQNVLNIQPVIPLHITEDWNLITRWITPVVYQPRVSSEEGPEFGLGNATPAFYLSPAKPGAIIWGVGATTWLPTATNKTLGINKWGAGPAAVALTIKAPWVVGILINNVWAGTSGQRVNQMLIQPFVNYNLPDGWYLTSSPIITSNWLAPENDRWLVPLGGGFGRLFKVDKLPVNVQAQAFYDVARPTGQPSWTLRFQLQFLFPS